MRTIFEPRLGKVKICHMMSANGVGIELFQFIEPAAESRLEEQDSFEYWKTGYFHIALTETNIEELADKIASTGGKRRTDVIELVPGSGRKFCFCEDPFGNIIEICSHIAMSSSGPTLSFRPELLMISAGTLTYYY